MVHRDPETGQFLSHDDDEPLELTYADHEFVNFDLLLPANFEGDNAGNDFAQIALEDDVLDLENDELAMLGYMTARLSAVARYEDDTDDAGKILVYAEVGSNLAGSEYLSSPAQAGGIQEIQTTGGIAVQGEANDEPGLWASLSCTVQPQVVNVPDGAGAGGVNGDDRLTRNYHEQTMGGPYIDATDDITVGVSTDATGTNNTVDITVQGQMAFVVFEYENRRAEFAPYDPGPMT